MTDEQKKELLELYFAMADALCEDLDQGVKWLTDRAHKDFAKSSTHSSTWPGSGLARNWRSYAKEISSRA